MENTARHLSPCLRASGKINWTVSWICGTRLVSKTLPIRGLILNGWDKFSANFLEKLAPHGPTPLLCGGIAIGGLVALVLEAPPWSVITLVSIVLVSYFAIMERKASWDRKDIRNAIDRDMAMGKRVRDPLRRRLELKKRESEPTLFDKSANVEDSE